MPESALIEAENWVNHGHRGLPINSLMRLTRGGRSTNRDVPVRIHFVTEDKNSQTKSLNYLHLGRQGRGSLWPDGRTDHRAGFLASEYNPVVTRAPKGFGVRGQGTRPAT